MSRRGPGGPGLAGLLQLTDSALPTGGFGHSGGIEALHRGGLLRDAGSLEAVLAGYRCLTLARGDGWFVREAYGAVEALDGRAVAAVARAELAARPAEVQRRTALALGRNLLRAASAIVEAGDGAERLAAASAALGDVAPRATAFGAVAAVLETGQEEAIEGHTFIALAGMVAAAVRLGATSALEGQRVLRRVLVGAREAPGADWATFSPLLDIAAMEHPFLEPRLFAS